MKPRQRLVSLHICLALFLAACASAAGGPGPRTWIDAPLDASTMELGPVVVRSHAASEGGTSQAVLLVNGAQVRSDAPPDPSARLVEFAQTWQPTAHGEYTLQVISTDHEGNEGRSNIVRVFVGQAPISVTETVVPTNTQVFTLTPVSPTPQTPTPAESTEPTFQFNQNANCRQGDSTVYEVVTAFSVGEMAPIEGRNQSTTWFWVPVAGGSAHCWVSAATGSPSGAYDTVQVIVPPPPPVTDTPTTPPQQQPPVAPSQFNITGEVCNAQEYSVTLTWADTATNESGYRLYRDGQLIATLGADASSYTDTPPNTNAHTYIVEAYNDAGASQSSTIQEDGCIF